MIGFLVKKTFFDSLDNFLPMLLLNIGFILCLAGICSPLSMYKGSPTLAILLYAVPGFILLHVYGGVSSSVLNEMFGTHSMDGGCITRGFRRTWKAALGLAGMNSVLVILIVIGLPFYFRIGNPLGLILSVIVFWFGLLWLLSLQFFFPFFLRSGGKWYAVIKKSIYFTLDNPWFSLFLFIFSIVVFIISLVTALLMPGVSAIMLFHQNAVHLRLYKYDWLNNHPGKRKNKIPWKSLLGEDAEKLGSRSLRGILFPWKD